jgi:uncharacterized protein (TIGR02145 family)
MKHLLLATMIMLSVTTQSQTIMRIHQSNGTVLQIPISTIDSITYTNSNPGSLATLTTLAVGNITANSATSGGSITADGGTPITQRGICWATTQNPTTANNTAVSGTGTGSFTANLTGLNANTTYYVRSYAINTAGTAYGNQLSFTTMEFVPNPLVDLTATVVSATQVNLSWTDNSTNEIGFKIQRKTGTQTFTDIATTSQDVTNYSDDGLTAGTTYTYRVYSFNNAGLSPTYSNEVIVNAGSIFNTNLTYGSVSDIDGNTYKTIQIGTQVWMAENLRTTKYRDGSNIPVVTDSAQWANNSNNGNPLQQPMMCWYNNDQATYTANKFGALYNWYAINPATNGNKNVCPTGWHVPTDTEWNLLVASLDLLYNPTADGIQSSTAGGMMKSTGIQFWQSPNIGATNSSGFAGLPGGVRGLDGFFYYINNFGYWWSSSENTTNNIWGRRLSYNSGEIVRGNASGNGGGSVRCLRD